MSEPKRAALLLPQMHPETQAEKDTFAAQQLACQLYAGTHDMVIVGLCDLRAGEDIEEPARDSTLVDEPELPAVGIGDFDVVLAVAPVPDDVTGGQFAQTIERLRGQQIDVLLIDCIED